MFLLSTFSSLWLVAHLLRPSRPVLEAALVAGAVQLWLAVLLDGACVALGLWRYTPGGGMALSVPLDLHLGWALGWGVSFALLAPADGRDACRVGLLWVVATLTADALLAPFLAPLWVPAPGSLWLLIDGALLALLLGVAWGLNRALLRRAARGALGRASLYLLAFGSITYLFLPEQVLRLTGRSLYPPPPYLQSATGSLLLVSLLTPPLALGAWAVWVFARAGGTPLPYDPPRRLVTDGPYRFLRNPMQLSAVSTFLILAALYRSAALLCYALDLFLLSELVYRLVERRALRQRFGAEYDAYATQVQRWY